MDWAATIDRGGELVARVAVAAVVVALCWLAAVVLTPVLRWMLERRGRPSVTRVFLGLFRASALVVGGLVALTVAFPSVRVADVLAIFGIVSVAAGFAFRDTFENLLAGVLLLLRDPFRSGDEVTVAERTGTVEGVTVRETLLRGVDGARFVVPNAKVMTGVIDVATHRELRRYDVRVRLDPSVDLGVLADALVTEVRSVTGVRGDPPPELVLVDLIDGDLEAEFRYWATSGRAGATRVRDQVLRRVAATLQRLEIEAPPSQVVVSLDDGRKGIDGSVASGGRAPPAARSRPRPCVESM